MWLQGHKREQLCFGTALWHVFKACCFSWVYSFGWYWYISLTKGGTFGNNNKRIFSPYLGNNYQSEHKEGNCSSGTVQRAGCFNISVELTDTHESTISMRTVYLENTGVKETCGNLRSSFLNTAWGRRFGTRIHRVRYCARWKKFCWATNDKQQGGDCAGTSDM